MTKSTSKAVAVALDVARRAKRADGGKVHVGPIISTVPGRTDRHNMNVPDGAYIVPAETVSHLGQSNTLAGLEVLKHMFPNSRQPVKKANGGSVPIVSAGGEFCISPDDVRKVGGGDLDYGHRVLDRWVMQMRKSHISTLEKLAPPAQD